MRPSRARAAAAAIALALVLPTAGAAEPTASPAPPRPASFTVSGGAALGAYEAGFLYYMLLAGQENGPGGLRLDLATGASAGSINSLLALATSRGGLPPDPYQSLFARVWLPVGFRQLFVPSEATALGAFSRKALLRDAARVEEAFRAGLPADLDVVLGVAVTRVTPREVPLAGGQATVPRTEEKFVVRIQGRGPGRWPRVTNYVAPDRNEEAALLPEDPGGEIPFPHLASLLVASAAFPVAFAPEPLAHCMVATRGRTAPYCPAASAETALFVDGGVFDNAPLRLAVRIAAAGLQEGPAGVAWLDAPRPTGGRPPAGVDFAFLSADARTYPLPTESKPPDASGGLPALLGEELASFVATARSKELELVVFEYPQVAEGLLFARRHFPAASEPMFAFFGFFEESFRRWDFTLGMYEARRQLLQHPVSRERQGARGAPFLLPEDGAAGRSAPGAWRPLACMRAVLDGEPDAAERCAGPDLETDRILLQVSLDRLCNDCLAVPEQDDLRLRYPSCGPVQDAAAPPRLGGLPEAPEGAWRRANGESDAAYVVRLLAGYGFDWKDMGYGRVDREHALIGLRRDLQVVVRTLARKQPDLGTRSTVQAAGNLGVDALAYFPPRNAVWLLFGRSLEVGGGTSVVDTLWLRLSGAVKIQNLLTTLSSDPSPLGIMPVAGVEFVPVQLGIPLVQASFLARVGYLFDLTDGGCAGEAGRTIGACSRPEMEGGAAAVFASIVRVQLLFEWYPPARGAPGLWNVAPTLGFQFGF